MKRLVVVSNRVADLEKPANSGGLAVALGAALERKRGVWIGWDGTVADDSEQKDIRLVEQKSVTIATLPLSPREYENYYLGFANSILWPAFHYRLDLGVFKPEFIEVYREVNRRIAEQTARLLRPDDIVWVHDYHLIPLATELRRLGCKQRIAFFLHIPFPPPEIFVAVPEYDWLARCLLEYDVVGLQTATDAANMLRYFSEGDSAEIVTDTLLRVGDRTVIVKPFPIGIDAEAIHTMARTPQAEEQIKRLQRRSMASTFVIGVDRLDYTKGLPERLRAFRRFIELHPELMKSVTLMQISPPTREEVEAYVDIRNQLEGLSGAINGEFGDFDWTPVRYIHRATSRATLAALLRGSRVGLVTPLRDGMNLVAKEYVAAQDEDDPGVLVLSKFAGAAEQLQEALIVNPYEIEEVAGALYQALTMPLDERVERHRQLIKSVRQQNIEVWREDCLNALRGCGKHARL